ncbi:hypothetical protein GPY51_23265 [Photorhabdus laumondii subsp. laumondii]|uniref:Uncharacterized protein n=1 Tax=Photorhabdus laumondii subsp. laumondii TaxID=141679 RepID=A0A6L9JQK2_PHOLM|nr:MULTISPECIES: hypothetical protein [Photorhabdus]MCC8386072.1 hypothetical protein [Photorhabdus laumondii]MCC8387411.1 hypothetical protein [Photorhabdus laumondii]MCC8415571.1 hypothetical protein [Photorhabdus laumondii]NDK97222.1 hypothetical protein [Photorhabdus laumondii subsp. laumondii]NDL16242.1 hypothetical protein [Photorhabdus laumondii subsp. laumondii]
MSKIVIGKHPKIAKQSNQGGINPLHYQLPDSEILTLYEQHQKHKHGIEKSCLILR